MASVYDRKQDPQALWDPKKEAMRSHAGIAGDEHPEMVLTNQR